MLGEKPEAGPESGGEGKLGLICDNQHLKNSQGVCFS